MKWMNVCWVLYAFGCGAHAGGSEAGQGSRAERKVRAASGAALTSFVRSVAAELPRHAVPAGVAVEEARSSAAIKRLIEGDLDLAFLSRPVRASEVADSERVGRGLHMVVVAAEAVAVVVHPDNPLREIGHDQLKKVFFTGELRDWAELTGGHKSGPIHVFAVNPKTSGTGELFVSTIAGEASTPYFSEATIVDYSDDTAAKVAADPDAISFTGMNRVDQSMASLRINSIAATEKTILDTSYILNRKLFAVTAGRPEGAPREVVKFMLSDRGQHLARAAQVTPIALE
jgi:phosphate transport system substrate-binding protein